MQIQSSISYICIHVYIWWESGCIKKVKAKELTIWDKKRHRVRIESRIFNTSADVYIPPVIILK